MKAIRTHELTPFTLPSSTTELDYIYNGLDCAVTFEVFEVLERELDNQTRATYEFSKSLMGCVLEMKLRGVKIDLDERARVIAAYEQQLLKLEFQLTRILSDGIGTSLNWRSPAQLQRLFYEVMGIPPIKKPGGRITVDREALERMESYFYARPIINHILGMRDIAKKIGVLKTDIDHDGRMRTNYNIAGTSTGRFSSNFSDFGTGTNLQNIEERLRRIFIADPGMKFAYIDLEQAESRLVGAIEWNLFHDGAYLDACESGDLHTAVCRLAWPHKGWTGDLATDRQIAEQPFYRQHSYRHMAKVLGHGTNYNGQPFTMAKHTKLPTETIRAFQAAYFAAFPAHHRWHAQVASDLARDGYLVSLSGRRRWFFGRRTDPSTIREAIAFDPQGSVGDALNKGMLQVWQLGIAHLLMQVHDAILIQYPENQEDFVVPMALSAIRVPIELNHDRTLIIPADARIGWNWSNASESNPDGLIPYRGPDSRTRSGSPAAPRLDKLL